MLYMDSICYIWMLYMDAIIYIWIIYNSHTSRTRPYTGYVYVDNMNGKDNMDVS